MANKAGLAKINMKPPLTYYGGKQKLCGLIVSLIPTHELYCEPFLGGAAVFFAKPPSRAEVLNDTNGELVNFYRVAQTAFPALEREVRATLHSRDLFRQAGVVYNNPEMFGEVKRAWATWVSATQSFGSTLDGSWGYDRSGRTTVNKTIRKRELFTEELAQRLQRAQIECYDALCVIASRDSETSFFYCDPPYFNSSCGHYGGYGEADFEALLRLLASIKGKFLLSSYPSDLLANYVKSNGWHTREIEQNIQINAKNAKRKAKKVEVLTANYPLDIDGSVC